VRITELALIAECDMVMTVRTHGAAVFADERQPLKALSNHGSAAAAELRPFLAAARGAAIFAILSLSKTARTECTAKTAMIANVIDPSAPNPALTLQRLAARMTRRRPFALPRRLFRVLHWHGAPRQDLIYFPSPSFEARVSVSVLACASSCLLPTRVIRVRIVATGKLWDIPVRTPSGHDHIFDAINEQQLPILA
jgi:hypothetical protein